MINKLAQASLAIYVELYYYASFNLQVSVNIYALSSNVLH